MRRVLLLFFIILIHLSANSQIVNIEKKRKLQNGFQATIGFDFNIKQSGSKILELKNIADLQYSFNAHNFILLNDIKLLSVDDGSLINNGFQHLRYNYTIRDSSFLTLEVFAQHQYNEQKLLQKRMLGGIGPRFRVINKDKVKWFLAPLVMYEYEDLDEEVLANEIIDKDVFRWDAYTNFRLSMNEIVSLNIIVYYQPCLNDYANYLLSGEAAMRFNLTKYLSYNVAYSADYDNDPPGDIQNTFWYFSNKLVFKF